ncbi:MAG: hypothetical protein V7K77_06760 [Nostoc sp.]|uniref:hypothetical protein n=1 Tax=Nostoc sp. TaxID=1180 RepID=UPI002FF7C36C
MYVGLLRRLREWGAGEQGSRGAEVQGKISSSKVISHKEYTQVDEFRLRSTLDPLVG